MKSIQGKMIGFGMLAFAVGVLLFWLLPPCAMILSQAVLLLLGGVLLIQTKSCRG